MDAKRFDLSSLADWLRTAFEFVLLRIVWVKVEWSESKDRSKKPVEWVGLANPEHALESFTWAKETERHTDDNAKHLLALSSALATLLIVVGNSADNRWWSAPAIVCLVLAVSLCIMVLGVRTVSEPLPNRLGTHDTDDWGEALMKARADNIARHHHRVDLYKAALRWFVLAMAATVVLLIAPRDSNPGLEPQLESLRLEIRGLEDSLGDNLLRLQIETEQQGRELQSELQSLRDSIEELHTPPAAKAAH